MPQTIVFDVNETLLDLAALDPVFERLFGDAGARREWFAQVLQSAMTVTLTGRYEDFSTVGAAALSMVAQRRGVTLERAGRQDVAAGMRRLPPHPEVADALARLRDAGFPLVALTNSAPEVMRDQLAHAGLSPLLDAMHSVDAARALKPARAVYDTAARLIGERPAALTMVAAHGWDIAGAMSTGWQGAFIARPGQVPEALFPAPTIIAADLAEAADALIARG
ncbi:(S)-2-haloacid dehalogenase [wastewater metagenome]|uniref:(S)-2-haloacid dehalogenase n=3 Tax=root TaxID=1 RepID=A0A5B8RJS9_9ZZZZ|nr:(S)-2-haloacid dehalogenase [uncultured organism]